MIRNGLCHPTVETLDGVQGGSVARRPLAPALWQADRDNRLRADGPERIADEWWQPAASGAGLREGGDAIRDYYRVEDEEGRRFWLFRAGLHGNDRPPRWFVHGVFS